MEEISLEEPSPTPVTLKLSTGEPKPQAGVKE
jgi:hypothetical protein